MWWYIHTHAALSSRPTNGIPNTLACVRQPYHIIKGCCCSAFPISVICQTHTVEVTAADSCQRAIAASVHLKKHAHISSPSSINLQQSFCLMRAVRLWIGSYCCWTYSLSANSAFHRTQECRRSTQNNGAYALMWVSKHAVLRAL